MARVRVRFFAAAREAAGCSTADLDAATLGEALDAVRFAHGAELAAVLDCARVWVNGDEPEVGRSARLRDGDELAVIPPVSGG